MIGLGGVSELRGQQIDHRRYLFMIPRRSQLLHYTLNLHKNEKEKKSQINKNQAQNPKKTTNWGYTPRVRHSYASHRAYRRDYAAPLMESQKARRPCNLKLKPKPKP